MEEGDSEGRPLLEGEAPPVPPPQLAHAAVQAKDAPAGFHAHAFKFQLARARWGAAPKGSRVQLSGGASDSVRNDEGLRDC